MTAGPIDPGQRRLAERRLLLALRRFHRSEPLSADIRADGLIARVRADPAERRPTGHRGAARLALDDAELHAVLDGLVTSGQVERQGRRVRLAGEAPELDPAMRERVERLLAELRSAGAEPPRVERPAARLGVPLATLDQLRRAGELVSVGAGIDYPRDVHVGLSRRIEAMAADGTLSVARLRDDLGTSRRYAEALLRHRAEERRRRG